jgi:hypothetical protein
MNYIQKLTDYGHASDFSEWCRNVDDPQFSRGSVLRQFDIDWVFWRKESFEMGEGPIMMIEEKCKDALMQPDQALMYLQIDRGMRKGSHWWHGFHVLRFENTDPSNGMTFLDDKAITIDALITFLKFGAPASSYVSWFEKCRNDGIDWRSRTQSRYNKG